MFVFDLQKNRLAYLAKESKTFNIFSRLALGVRPTFNIFVIKNKIE